MPQTPLAARPLLSPIQSLKYPLPPRPGTLRSKQVWQPLDPISTHIMLVVEKLKERVAEYEPDEFRNPSPQPEASHMSPVSVSVNYFFGILNSFRHNIIIWSNMLTGSRSSSRLHCHRRPCRTLLSLSPIDSGLEM